MPSSLVQIPNPVPDRPFEFQTEFLNSRHSRQTMHALNSRSSKLPIELFLTEHTKDKLLASGWSVNGVEHHRYTTAANRELSEIQAEINQLQEQLGAVRPFRRSGFSLGVWSLVGNLVGISCWVCARISITLVGRESSRNPVENSVWDSVRIGLGIW